jgi:hypothetical protein
MSFETLKKQEKQDQKQAEIMIETFPNLMKISNL